MIHLCLQAFKKTKSLTVIVFFSIFSYVSLRRKFVIFKHSGYAHYGFAEDGLVPTESILIAFSLLVLQK